MNIKEGATTYFCVFLLYSRVYFWL